jgi:long-subunit acyl-CoA synthetase (AMP-forming)
MLLKLAQDMGIAETDVGALCENGAIVEEVSKQCAAACKQGKLANLETPRKYGLVADTFSPENDCLTAAMKLKRPVTAKIHAELIKKVYG